MPEQATPEQIFTVLSDRHSIGIMKMAYSGFKATSTGFSANLSKKQFYMRLKKLRDMGFIEKRNTMYKTTTFGSLVYQGQIRAMEEMLANYWNLKAVDVLKSRQDFPLQQKEKVIEEIIRNSNLKNFVNNTHLTGFSVLKDYNRLFVEVQLPLALPVIIAGIRIATVTTIGLVTIAGLIGYGGFGFFIVDGLRSNLLVPKMLLGAVATMAMALIADAVLLLIERVLTPWSRGAATV